MLCADQPPKGERSLWPRTAPRPRQLQLRPPPFSARAGSSGSLGRAASAAAAGYAAPQEEEDSRFVLYRYRVQGVASVGRPNSSRRHLEASLSELWAHDSPYYRDPLLQAGAGRRPETGDSRVSFGGLATSRPNTATAAPSASSTATAAAAVLEGLGLGPGSSSGIMPSTINK